MSGRCSASGFDGGCGAAADCEAGLTCVGGACVCGFTESVGNAPTTWTGMIPGAAASAYSTSVVSERMVECTSNCASYQPTYTSAAIVPVVGPASLGASIVDLGGGGRAVAWIDLGSTTLHYSECAGDCSDGGAWFDVVVDSNHAARAPPAMAISASGIRGIAFPGNGNSPITRGLLYAECAGNCTQAVNWTETDPAGRDNQNNNQGRLGLAFQDQAGGGLLRMLSDGRTYLECTSNCAAGLQSTATWPLSSGYFQQQGNGDQVLLVGAQGLPRIAIANCTQILVEDCSAEPCTNMANWSSTQLSANATCNSGELDFALDGQGLGRIVYESGNAISLATEVAAGVGTTWSLSTLTTCGGASLAGSFPSLGLTPYGGLRIHYAVSGNAGHAIYAIGP